MEPNKLILQLVLQAILVGVLIAAIPGIAIAAPPGETPFGVYDPPGDFADDDDVQIEHLFLPWEDVFLPSLIEADQYALDRNRAILITIEPWTWSRSERNAPDVLIVGIQSGEYDRYMQEICSALASMRSPVTVRWAQEMDDFNGQFIWAGWEPDTYISAYRQVVDICRATAPAVNYMWSPSGDENMADFYPGDDYVDLVGLSVFGLQPFEETTLGRSLSFSDILSPKYDRATQFNKPIVVAELGYVGNAEYVEDWSDSVRQSFEQFPDLVGVVYFNQKEVYPWPDGFGFPNWQFGEHTLEDVAALQ